MKLRYLTLFGLLMTTLGCFLPFEIQDGIEHRLFPAWPWLIPILGIMFLVLSREGPFGNGRVLGGLFGLLIGIIAMYWAVNLIIDIDGLNKVMGIYIAYQAYIIILVGSFLACLGGFTHYKRTSSRMFHLGTLSSLTSIGVIFIILLVSYFPQNLPFASFLSNNFSWFLWLMFLCLAMIFIGSILIVKESRKTI